jgi:hypothetical protein
MMDKKLFKNTHYNTPGHAHELTFSKTFMLQDNNVFSGLAGLV